MGIGMRLNCGIHLLTVVFLLGCSGVESYKSEISLASNGPAGESTQYLLKTSDFFDTRASNSMNKDDSLFEFENINGKLVLTTESTLTNIHSHVVNGMVLKSYIFSGRMMFDHEDAGMGFTFMSQYPNKDAYYRFRRYHSRKFFHIENHGNEACLRKGMSQNALANTWYEFEVQVVVNKANTTFNINLRKEGDPLSKAEVINCVDFSAQRFQSGTVGVWSMGKGKKHWADFRITIDPFAMPEVADNGGSDPMPTPTPEPPEDPSTESGESGGNNNTSENDDPVEAPEVVVVANSDMEWAKGRDIKNHLVVNSGNSTGDLIFQYARVNENVKSPTVGHNLPGGVENRLFYNIFVDGYQGLPPGNCLMQAKFIKDSTRDVCARTENKDLLRNWAQKDGKGMKNVLIKNLTVKNAIRTINNSAASGGLPHVDTFQTYYAGSSSEVATAQYLVIQDTIFKNSDNSMMISSAVPHRGIVYQNLKSGFCDSWFAKDSKTRRDNDYLLHGHAIPSSPKYLCTNPMTARIQSNGNIWMINAQSSGTARVDTKGGPLILIGSSQSMKILNTTPGPICKYNYIEDALNDKDASDGCGNFDRPPFIQLSCSGWKVKPDRCVDHQGAFIN